MKIKRKGDLGIPTAKSISNGYVSNKEPQHVSRKAIANACSMFVLAVAAPVLLSVNAFADPTADLVRSDTLAKSQAECSLILEGPLRLGSSDPGHHLYEEGTYRKEGGSITLFRAQFQGYSFSDEPVVVVLRSPVRIADDPCDVQLKEIGEIETASIALLLKTQREWKTIGSRFPANTKRLEKIRTAYSDTKEAEAVKLVGEILKNGALEDEFLKEFDWTKYRNDVQFAYGYLKACKGDYRGLRQSLEKQAKMTEARLENVEDLIKRVRLLLDIDKTKFIGTNDDTVTWEDFLKRPMRGAELADLVIALKDFQVAIRNAKDVGTRTALLPRLLERAETYAYLKALATRYDTHLNMQNVVLDDLKKSFYKRDCEKCRGESKKPLKAPESSGLWVAGDWYTSYGVMKLDQTANKVKGTYANDGGRVEGEMSGNQMNGFWAENDSAHKCDTAKLGSYYWGQIRIEFKGEHFTAKWNYCGREDLSQGGWDADLIKLRVR